MTLSVEEIDIVRASFREISRERARLPEVFYRRLFEVAPELRSLFKHDMAAQNVKMMNTLGAIVARIHDSAALRPMVIDLARRHAGYGVSPRQYYIVGNAMLWALERVQGDSFTAEIGAAWAAAYSELAEVMVDAAYGERQDNVA